MPELHLDLSQIQRTNVHGLLISRRLFIRSLFASRVVARATIPVKHDFLKRRILELRRRSLHVEGAVLVAAQ